MSQMWGADIDELTQLATRFDQTAQQMNAIRSSVTNALGQASWKGADADRFRQEWSSQSVPALASAANAFQQCAQTLRHAAQLQQQASAAGGLVAPVGVGPRGPAGAGSGGLDPWQIVANGLKGVGLTGTVIKFLTGDFARNLPGVETGLKYLANEFPALRTVLPGAAKYLPIVGDAGDVIQAGIDGRQFVQDLHQYGFTAVPTLEAGLNTIADGASMVPGYGTAVSLGIHGAEFLYNLDPQLDQTLHDDFWRGWDTVSTGVKDTVANAWNTGTTDVKNVATGAWNDAQQGWHDLTSWIP